MSEQGLARPETNAEIMERVLLTGDLSALNAGDRLLYYQAVCASVGLNPLTKPFEYLYLNNKLVLYARKDATEQLRKLHGVSIPTLTTARFEDVYVVTAHAIDKEGRSDSATGAVYLGTLKGDALANAFMKAETKAKRRVTLSICGLGMLDETEVETIIGARRVTTAVNGELPIAEMKKGAAPQGRRGAKPESPIDLIPGRPPSSEPSAETLFPAPIDDDLRDQLATDAKRVGDLLKLSAKERSEFFVTYCGKSAKWNTAELPALTELVNALRARIGEVKWGENAP